MSIEDGNALDPQAAALGIVHCLRMLAEEAESLRLYRTLEAIRAAMDVCVAENAQDTQVSTEREDTVARYPMSRNHYH